MTVVAGLPTLGRIVLAQNLDRGSNNGSTEAPAIITRVWSPHSAGAYTVNAKVILDGHDDLWLTSVLLFDDHVKAAAWLTAGAESMGATFNPPFLIWPARA